jgi:hypothetical protein
VRSQGWSNVPDEAIIGLNAVAAPVLDARYELVAMIGIIGANKELSAKLPFHVIAGIWHCFRSTWRRCAVDERGPAT